MDNICQAVANEFGVPRTDIVPTFMQLPATEDDSCVYIGVEQAPPAEGKDIMCAAITRNINTAAPTMQVFVNFIGEPG